jgi:hypothetical protein
MPKLLTKLSSASRKHNFNETFFIFEYKIMNVTVVEGARDGAVVEALRYKPEGGGIDSRLEIFIDIILPAALWL